MPHQKTGAKYKRIAVTKMNLVTVCHSKCTGLENKYFTDNVIQNYK